MVNLEKLSKYQQVYKDGKVIKGWEYARSNKRIGMIDWEYFKGKDVLDLGCSNGMFCLEAKRRGANRVIGVDNETTSGPCIDGARELAEEENLEVEFWKTDIESREFLNFCPQVDITFFFSLLRYMKDPRKMLEFISLHTRNILYFETNEQKEFDSQIETVREYTSFSDYWNLGLSEDEEKRGHHFLWKCARTTDELVKTNWDIGPITFIPIERIKYWTPEKLGWYDTNSLEFQNLKNNILENGLRRPVIVERLEPGGSLNQSEYRGVNGAHRYFVLKELGFKDIPCRIVTKP